MAMSSWQRVRTRLHLFLVGVGRRITLGARVVVIDGDRILLIRHTYIPGWHFPGGGVEPGETAADAGSRELREEAGIEAEGPLTLFGFFHNQNRVTNRDHVALFVCRDFRAVREFVANLEIAEIGWFSADALPTEIDPGSARRIAEITHGRVPDPRW
jgi:8-oxo-dGTP pyrophosphatase MutT (NUDIX family)